jgi:hypothetical protein
MNNSSEVSPTVKGGLAAVAGGSAVALGATYWQRWEVLAIIIVGGAVVVGVMLLLFRMVLKFRERGRDAALRDSLGVQRGNRDVSNPEDRAKIDQLANRFQEGVDIYRAAGKNLYSLPWYVLVGEPGSGKTEMLRHSDVPVPQGLSDLPGVGGTINMNWWFTEKAVVLDTAGRIMFQQVEAGKTTEWKTFLELLKKARPNCPINGLMLVIPAESLIRDNQSRVVEKAKKIARQFDLIQRTLDIRFPVFIVITKSDLINGFRSFFERVDIRDQGQMLGWSNPSQNLDDPFEPEDIDRHLSDVRQRLLRRRTALLLDPVSKIDPAARRADEVDDLYAFPDALMTIGPRLQLYLSTIFVAGEWSPKPLFLRGIYFTSSMRQGAALDTELAQALGLPVESLPEGRAWKQDESYFLKDMFLRKVFPEKGLVTRQSKAQGLDGRRKAIVLTAASLAVVGLLALTYFGKQQMEQAILGPAESFRLLADNYKKHKAAKKNDDQGTPPSENDQYWQIVRLPLNTTKSAKTAVRYEYAGNRKTFDLKDGKVPLVGELHKDVLAQVKQPLVVPYVFRPVAFLEKSLLSPNDLRDAYKAVLEQTVLVPLVEAAQKMMATVPANDRVTPEAAMAEQEALRQLIRIEALAAATTQDTPRPPVIELRPLFRYVLPPDQFKTVPPAHIANLQDAVDWCYGTGKDDKGVDRGGAPFPPKDAEGRFLLASRADGDAAIQAIEAGVKRFDQYWGSRLAAKSFAQRDGDVVRLLQKLDEIRTHEDGIRTTVSKLPATQTDVAAYGRVAKIVRDYVADLDRMATEADGLFAKVKEQPGGWARDDTMVTMFARELKKDIADGTAAYATFQAEALPSPRLAKALAVLRIGKEKLPKEADEPLDASAKKDFETLQEMFLWPPMQPADVPAYRRYANAYRTVTDRLPDLSTPPPPAGAVAVAAAERVPSAAAAVAAAGGKSFDEQMDAIRADVKTVVDDVSKKLLSGSQEQPKKVLEACGLVEERLVAPARRYQAVEAVLARVPATVELFATNVASVATAQGRGARQLDPLPLTELATSHVIKAQYDSAAAKVPLGAWQAAVQRLEAVLSANDSAGSPGAGSAEPLLDVKGLRGRMDTLRAAVINPYLIAYANYWCDLAAKAKTVPPASWKPGPGKEWDAYATQLPDGKMANAALQKIRLAVAGALAGIVVDPKEMKRVSDTLAATQLADATAAPERVVPQQQLEKRSTDAMTTWRRLSRKDDGTGVATPAIVADRFEAMGAQKVWDDLMIVETGSLSADYWTAVTRLGFDLIVRNAPDREAESKGLVGKLSLYPVGPAPTKPGDRVMTLAEAQAARATVNSFLARAATAAKSQADLGGKPQWFADGFGKLMPRGGNDPRLRRAKLILDACGESVSVFNVGLDKQKQLAGPAKTGRLEKSPIGLIRLNVPWPASPSAYPIVPNDINGKLGEIAFTDIVSGNEMKFEMRESGFNIPLEKTQLKEPVGVGGSWSAFRLLQSFPAGYEALPGVADAATTWFVELPREDPYSKGAIKSVWVKVVFAKPMPVSIK